MTMPEPPNRDRRSFFGRFALGLAAMAIGGGIVRLLALPATHTPRRKRKPSQQEKTLVSVHPLAVPRTTKGSNLHG